MTFSSRANIVRTPSIATDTFVKMGGEWKQVASHGASGGEVAAYSVARTRPSRGEMAYSNWGKHSETLRASLCNLVNREMRAQ